MGMDERGRTMIRYVATTKIDENGLRSKINGAGDASDLNASGFIFHLIELGYTVKMWSAPE